MEPCFGCGGLFPGTDGPTHRYMQSSSGCFAAFNALLAAEYSSVDLGRINRLTVDTWAVQHPGDPNDRRAVQSVGLHLARLMLQLACPRPPAETNQVMLDFACHKHTLRALVPPSGFSRTVADVAPFAGTPQHVSKVHEWAEATWKDWSHEHAYIGDWIARHSDHAVQPGQIAS